MINTSRIFFSVAALISREPTVYDFAAEDFADDISSSGPHDLLGWAHAFLPPDNRCDGTLSGIAEVLGFGDLRGFHAAIDKAVGSGRWMTDPITAAGGLLKLAGDYDGL